MSACEFDVLGIGNAIVDILSQCDDNFIEKHNLPKGHMQLIEPDQAARLYENMGPAIEVSGGSAANTCAGLASFGSRAAFLGKVADDGLGKVFTHDLRASGVHFNVATDDNCSPTAYSMILVTPDGERTMNTYLGACVQLGRNDISPELIRSSRVTYLEGYLFDPPEAQSAFQLAARTAAGAGREVALSLSDSFCVDRHRAAFRMLVREGVDILFANEEEICSLYETEDFFSACSTVRKECKLAALTRGKRGSVIVTADDIIEIEPVPVLEVADTTGAGDLYAAGFLHGYTQGRDLLDCGRLASLAAGEIISHLGARPEHSLQKLAEQKGL
jgi:sugar/nucleoside kinase (ribokinase family)